jgi:hypothetical protein
VFVCGRMDGRGRDAGVRWKVLDVLFARDGEMWLWRGWE